MSNFCFFTDADLSGLLNPQAQGSAFGVVSESEFRVTSLHTAASTPRAFAICDGKVTAQQDSQTHIVNLILKPKDQPGGGNRINFVAIKYIIYKGILKDSLIAGSGVADRSKNQLTQRAHKTQDAMNRATEVLLEEPANSITLTASGKLLGYDIVGGDDESLDKLFYKQNNSLFESLSVVCGDYIGDFDRTLFGIEIVLDDIRADANFVLTRRVETKLQAPVASANNSQLFKRRHQQEAAISFMDPCAFFGSFFQHGLRAVKLRYRLSADTIDVEKETKDSNLHKANGAEIYEKILVHFFNKNAVYIDIRNELNTSLNFYQHYDNNVRIRIPKADNEIVDRDYYGNGGWPLLVLRPADFDLHGQSNDSDKDVIKIEIALPNPADENAAPLVYISQGYLEKIQRNKVLRGEKRYVRLSTAADDYTESFSLALANISGESVITPVSQYIRIKYLKSVLQGASSGIVPRATYYLDLLFLPFRMKIPFAVTANSKSRVYHEDTFIGLSEVSGCESAGAVGIAQDTKNITLFAYAGDKLRTTGTTRLATISLASEMAATPHYLSSVRDRYRREELVQGQVSIQSLAAHASADSPTSAFPGYLRFVDQTPEAVSDLSDANLRDEFVAVLIKKEKLADAFSGHPFSSDYDIFIRFRNKVQDVDPAGVEFTSYDLALEGHVDDGTSIELDTFDTGVKAYSSGRDHNLIFLDRDADYDASAPQDTLPLCPGTFSQPDLGHLKKFIEKTSTALEPFKSLWTKVFNIAGGARIKVDGEPPNPYVIDNPYPLDIPTPPAPPPPLLPNGYLAEACTIFTLYKFQQQLLADTAQDSDIDAPGKSAIYKGLKETLRSLGFRKPAPGLATLAFNKMMNPDRHIGLRGLAFLDENQPTSTNPIPDPATDPLKKVMYNLMKVGNLPNENGDKKFDLKRAPLTPEDLLPSIDLILKKCGEKIVELLKQDSSCAYKILSKGAQAPSNLFLATGDGSATSGIFSIPPPPPPPIVLPDNQGVLLFNYDYDGKGGVMETATRPFPSLPARSSTAVHLTMIGLDTSGFSTVEVIKDKINCKFEANITTAMRPVNGTSSVEARFDPVTQTFYTESGSGRTDIAHYDSGKGDLQFIQIGRTFAFDVKLNSFHTSQGAEEVFVCINVIEGPKLAKFDFEVEKFFASDEFLLTPEQKNKLLKAKDAEAVEFLIKKLMTLTYPPIIYLQGHFVGKYLEARDRTSGSKVTEDPRYQFHKTREQDRTLEASGEADPRLKYSFGTAVMTDKNVIISIDSFVSPQWSRLDLKVPPGTKPDLDSLTNYYVIPGSDAYVDHIGGDPHPTDPDHPKLPSYNPILSGLRSFGVAEALKDILVARAEASGLYLEDDIEILKDYLEAHLAVVKVLENRQLGIGKEITFQDYNKFRP
jgi:hypothetical protein